MSTGTARDLSAKLQSKLVEVLQRELAIFQHVLSPTEIGEVMIEAATMVGRTTAATVAGYATEQADIERLYRGVIEAIVESIRSREADGISRVVSALQARGA